MGSTTDKVKGTANEAIGKVKQGVGEATGDDRMKRDGNFQEAKGDFQKGVGKAKEGIKNTLDEAARR